MHSGRRKISKQTSERFSKKLLRASLSGSAVGFCMLLILLAITAVLYMKNSLSVSRIFLLALLFSGGSALVCGFTAGKQIRSRGFMVGAVSVLPLLFITFCITLICAKGAVETVFLTVFPVMLFGGAVGGILSVNTRR